MNTKRMQKILTEFVKKAGEPYYIFLETYNNREKITKTKIEIGNKILVNSTSAGKVFHLFQEQVKERLPNMYKDLQLIIERYTKEQIFCMSPGCEKNVLKFSGANKTHDIYYCSICREHKKVKREEE